LRWARGEGGCHVLSNEEYYTISLSFPGSLRYKTRYRIIEMSSRGKNNLKRIVTSNDTLVIDNKIKPAKQKIAA
jgi:hypothetical protein